jgi:hypothetical protein
MVGARLSALVAILLLAAVSNLHGKLLYITVFHAIALARAGSYLQVAVLLLLSLWTLAAPLLLNQVCMFAFLCLFICSERAR